MNSNLYYFNSLMKRLLSYALTYLVKTCGFSGYNILAINAMVLELGPSMFKFHHFLRQLNVVRGNLRARKCHI